jgi:cellulose synthase/poly-beta-1,6-N-acetylglucosamine synthase-like glycosyltransferase
MNVSIVIPVYNEEGYLPACLDALSKQTVKPAEVIVVDNNSTDNTVKIAKNYPFVRIVKEPRQGTVFARNAGFKAAKSEIIGRIDADTRVPADWVAKLIKTFQDDLGVAAITGKPRFYDTVLAKFFNLSQVFFYQMFQKLLTGSYVLWGTNMAIRREVWQEVSTLCVERTDIDEDIDLSFWLLKKGYRIRYLPDLPAEASFQRGRTGFSYTVPYLATWPRDYLLHRMYLRAAFIALLIGVGLVVCSPFLLVSSLKPNPAD